jgi:cell division protein FtsZ
MGTATAKGEGRATLAAQAAIASPLLEAGAIDGARGILINVTGSSSLRLAEVNEASTIIQSAAHEDANIIFGAVLDEKMKDEVKITVIATGFKDVPRQREQTHPAVDAVHNARVAAASVHATYEVPSVREPQKPSPARLEPVISAESEAHQPLERPQSVSYVPDDFEDISEIVRHAEPKEEQPVHIETVSSSPDINYNADDLEVPAFMRKRNTGVT